MRRLPFGLASLLLLAAACSASPEGEPAADAGSNATSCLTCADASDDAPVATRVYRRLASCNGIEGCHASGAAGLAFPAGAEARELVGVPSTERPELLRVAPFDPANSYVYLKVVGDGGIDGAVMPEGAYDPSLPPLFFAWIEAGAPSPP